VGFLYPGNPTSRKKFHNCGKILTSKISPYKREILTYYLLSTDAIGYPLLIQFCFKLTGILRSLPFENPMSFIILKAGLIFGHFSNGQHPQ
jgi:hypothetical protein